MAGAWFRRRPPRRRLPGSLGNPLRRLPIRNDGQILEQWAAPSGCLG